ncbi:MAG: hypothetical protein H0V22_03045 [Solirubrobacterales bacterium]|nr:hypothetical protein [Solirubrobacterales bacterium]
MRKVPVPKVVTALEAGVSEQTRRTGRRQDGVESAFCTLALVRSSEQDRARRASKDLNVGCIFPGVVTEAL